MVDAIYARYRHSRDIDSVKPLTPPLAAAETAWLEENLRNRQARE
jgi:hypothetical protein